MKMHTFLKKKLECFANSKRVPTFATAKEKNTLRKHAKLRLGDNQGLARSSIG